MITTQQPGRHRPENAAARIVGGRHSAGPDQATLDPMLVRWSAERTRVATDAVAARRAARRLAGA